MKTIIAKSDCLLIKESHANTCLIKYTSENDYADIVYTGATPPIFQIRVEAQFFRDRFPEEDEEESFDDGSVINLSSEIRKQIALMVEPAPSHIHEILMKALKHSSVTITNHETEDIPVSKGEKYEREDMDLRSPLSKASCWLNIKTGEFFTNVFNG